MNESLDELPLKVSILGLRPYREVLELQRKIHKELVAGNREQCLLICEHPPVITHGKSAKEESLLSHQESLKENEIDLLQVERGGDYTYHGPGQLVAYPILDLKTRKKDVGWYMRSLEEVVLNLLEEHGVHGERVSGRTGVFVSKSSQNKPFQKICSIGVRISRWCTYHGLALYLTTQRKGFVHLNPCGYSDIEVVSLEDLGIECGRPEMENRFIELFCKTFQYQATLKEI